MRGTDWTRNVLVLGIALMLVGAWRIYERSSDPGDGRTGALALMIIAAVLVGALITDWARRGDKHDNKDDPGTK